MDDALFVYKGPFTQRQTRCEMLLFKDDVLLFPASDSDTVLTGTCLFERKKHKYVKHADHTRSSASRPLACFFIIPALLMLPADLG